MRVSIFLLQPKQHTHNTQKKTKTKKEIRDDITVSFSYNDNTFENIHGLFEIWHHYPKSENYANSKKESFCYNFHFKSPNRDADAMVNQNIAMNDGSIGIDVDDGSTNNIIFDYLFVELLIENINLEIGFDRIIIYQSNVTFEDPPIDVISGSFNILTFFFVCAISDVAAFWRFFCLFFNFLIFFFFKVLGCANSQLKICMHTSKMHTQKNE